MTAAPTRVTRCAAVLVVRTMAVVRVAGVTALGPVSDALIALVLVLVTVAVIIIVVTVVIAVAVAVAAAALATDDRGARNRHVSDSHAGGVSLGSPPRVPVQAATGEGDRRSG